MRQPRWTPTKQQTLVFIRDYQKEWGIPPSRTEIAEHFDICVTAAQQRVRSMVSMGAIELYPGVSRGIYITAKGKRFAP
jgi:Mn-dependent DtxR family transcriptional regulator